VSSGEDPQKSTKTATDRSRKSTDRQHNGQQEDKRLSTKHYSEN